MSDALESVVMKRRARKGKGAIVDDIMTRPAITIRGDDSLRTAVTVMDTGRVERLVVADEENRVRAWSPAGTCCASTR